MSLRTTYDAWRSRPAHERWLIGLPVAALLIAGLYIGVWEPLQASIGRLHAALPELALRRETVRSETAALRGPTAAASAPNLRTTQISAALERRQLGGGIATIQPAGENRARLAFQRVSFHSLWPLLQDLQNEQGLRVVSLRMDRLDASQVRVEAVIGAGER